MLNKLKKQKMLKDLMGSSDKEAPMAKIGIELEYENESDDKEEGIGEECPHCGMKIKEE